MKTSLFILLATFCLMGAKTLPEAQESQALGAGTYYLGDGLGVNISVVLHANGQYVAVWEGCMGVYGNSNGQWKASGQELIFKPSKEDGMLKSFLVDMKIVEYKGKTAFIAAKELAEHHSQLEEFGESFSVYTRQKP